MALQEDEYTDKNTIYFERCTFQDNNPIDIYAYDPFTCLSSCPGEATFGL